MDNETGFLFQLCLMQFSSEGKAGLWILALETLQKYVQPIVDVSG